MLALLRLDPSLFPDGGSAGTTAAAVFEEALDAADALRLEEADLVRLRTDEDAKLQVCAKLIYGWQCRWNGFGFGDRCRYRSCVPRCLSPVCGLSSRGRAFLLSLCPS